MNTDNQLNQIKLEFCQWLLTNAEQLQLTNSKSLNQISQAKNINDIEKGLEGLLQELGREKFEQLATDFDQNRKQNIKMAQHGTKLNSLVSKLKTQNILNNTKYLDPAQETFKYKSPDNKNKIDNSAKYKNLDRRYLTKYWDRFINSNSQTLPKKDIRNNIINKMATGGVTDNPKYDVDTTFVKRMFPVEDGLEYQNEIHVTRYPYRDHSNPAARWQSEHENYVEHISSQNDTTYFNTFYDANHIGNKSNIHKDKENQKKLFDRHRNRDVWEDSDK